MRNCFDSWTICRAWMLAIMLLLASAPVAVAAADLSLVESTSPFLRSRQAEDSQLERDVESADNGARATALLTLADRNLNRSVQLVEEQLQQVAPLLEPGSEAEAFYQALRCQLLSRQALAAAVAACVHYTGENFEAAQSFVGSYAQFVRAFVLYREGDHHASLEAAYMALESAEQTGDRSLLALSHNLIGVHYSTRMLPRMALPHLEIAWDRAYELPYPELQQVVQVNLSSVYLYLGRNQEALEQLGELKGGTAANLYATRRLVIESLHSMALSGVGRWPEAETEMTLMLDELAESVQPDVLALAHTALGRAQLGNGRLAQALQSFETAIRNTGQTVASGLDHPRVQAVLIPYARALRLSQRPLEARRLLSSIINRFPEDDPNQLLIDAHNERAKLFSAVGDSARSLESSEKASVLSEQLRDASFDYQISRLNAELERGRRSDQLALALEREATLKEQARIDARSRYQGYLLAAFLVVIGYLWFGRRMQKRIADSERSANERLEELVQTRSRELEAQITERMLVEDERGQLTLQLVESEKMRAVGQLTAGVAHDFNNLMTVVTLSAEQLQEYPDIDSAERVELAGDILSAVQSGAQITSQLLAYSRKQQLQRVEFRLDELLSSSLPMLRNTLGERYELTTQLEACTVSADPAQTTTSVLNLLLNARESLANNGSVQLTLQRKDGFAEIVVEDNGAGMSPEALARACDPFYTTKQVGAGAGLGLSMVYGFAQQSDGDLVLDSTLGVGTVVRLRLPLMADKVEQDQSADAILTVLPQNLDVLVVDDQPVLLQLLQETTTRLGMCVRTAQSADEAIQQIEERGLPELLISDVVMPGELDGRDLANTVRKRAPDLPIILISGYSEHAAMDFTLLKKPFTLAELKETVAEELQKARVSG